MAIRSIPDEVLSLSFEEVLEISFGRFRSVDLNPVELLFACTFLHNGWRVVRTPMNRNHPIAESNTVAIERATGVEDALFGSGVPDLFLWDTDGRHRFVEVKASEDSLNENQREWAETYDWELDIAQLAHADESLSDEEIMERNRLT
ncbi:VRR-NUC domain-containing protein [Halobacterium hubeiense]|nr:VRR-NUC domain-containing protein [Halobacterium hubeiense]